MAGFADSAQPISEATPRVAYNYANAVLIFALALLIWLAAAGLQLDYGLSFIFFIPGRCPARS